MQMLSPSEEETDRISPSAAGEVKEISTLISICRQDRTRRL